MCLACIFSFRKHSYQELYWKGFKGARGRHDRFRTPTHSIRASFKYFINRPAPVNSGGGPGCTYIPSTRNVLHIVLGAQACADVTEVQFLGDYLNLNGAGTAAGDGQGSGSGRVEVIREGEEEERIEEERGKNKSRSKLWLARKSAGGCGKVPLGKSDHLTFALTAIDTTGCFALQWMSHFERKVSFLALV